jgi:hypothetical protein
MPSRTPNPSIGRTRNCSPADDKLRLLISYEHTKRETTLILELPALDVERVLTSVAQANSEKEDPSKHVKARVALDANYNLADCRNPAKELLITKCPYGAPGLIKASAAVEDSISPTKW